MQIRGQVDRVYLRAALLPFLGVDMDGIRLEGP